ncbi:retrovirus-related pol polyprotein from transposon TNT 1-94 [Tanacetum coccineum]
MCGTIPPIPPPFRTSSGNPGSPNVNRFDTMPTTTDLINITTTTNVSQSVVGENLPQLLNSRRGSHVINVPAFDKEDFTSWKVRFLVFLDGLEPYLLKTLEDGPFVPMSSLSTFKNHLPKRQNQWSNAESRLANQDKRLKSIIISCLPNDVMKSVIKCKTTKEMWNDLILAHKGPSDIRDTKIAALRLKFNAFKSLKGEKVNETFTRLKFLLNDLKNNGVTIPQVEDSDSDVEEDQRTSNEFMADQNAEYHERALLDDKYVSSDDEGSTKIRAFMAIAEEEPSAGKADARSGQWVDITMKKNESLGDEIIDLKKVIEKLTCSKVTLDQLLSEQVPGNIVKALGGKGRRKEKISSKEVVFTKADESSSMLAPEITSDSESECDSQDPLPPLPKLIGAAPSSTSESLISLSDLTLNMADLTLDTLVPKKTRPFVKVSPAYVIKKKTEKFPAVPKHCSDKKADSSTEQLLLTPCKQIKILLGTPLSSSQPSCSKVTKQNTWFGPCKHCGFKNHLFDDCYSKPKCSTCGSTDHLTKEHLKHVVVKKTLIKLKVQSPLKPSPNKAPMIPKPFKECKYCDLMTITLTIVSSTLGVKYVVVFHMNHLTVLRNTPTPGYQGLPTGNQNPLKSGFTKGTNPYENVSAGLPQGPKVVSRDDSLGDTEGYGSVNCNGITFTRVAYPNGLKHNLISINDYSRYTWVFCLKKKSDAADGIMYFIKKIENLNEVRVNKLRSDNRTEFRNHKPEEFCDEKGISQNFSSPCTPEQNGVAERRNKTLIEAARTMLNSAKLPKQFWGEDVNTACYTQNRSIIMKRHGKTSYDMFRGRSPDISYFHEFGCHVHIHNHKDHLGKFDEKYDDGFFLGYSPVAKAFRVFNIKRQEMEEIVHCPGDTKYFPFIPAYENTTPSESSILQVCVTSEDPPEFTEADNHPALNEPDQTKSVDPFKPIQPQNNVSIEPISDVQPSPTIPPSREVILQTHVPQDRWSREKHIELVNIIGEPLAGITTRSRIRDSDAASSFECLYVNFFSEMEPKKLIEALEEEGWNIDMQDKLPLSMKKNLWFFMP